MSTFTTLRHGGLDEVAYLVDTRLLDEGEVRAVLLNLIDRVKRLQKHAETTHAD